MTMKPIFILSIWAACSLAVVQAQPGKLAEERIRAFRVAYFTDKLRLTPEESQQFWPLYNEFRDKVKALKRDQISERPVADLSDAEADAYIQDLLSSEEKEISLKREYFQRLRKVIPPRKLALIPQTEKAFNKSLLERMREIRERRGG